jgi:thiol-disulfide isomerase/thioredoxin
MTRSLLLLTLAPLTACGLFSRGEPAGPEGSTPDEIVVGDTSDPCSLRTWDTVGAPFVATWCTPCHSSALPVAERSGAPYGVDFDTEADVVAHLDRFQARALDAAGTPAGMPPSGGPDAALLARVQTWLDCLPEPAP